MALKEVNTKQSPEADVTQEKVIGFEGLDDAFVLAQAEKKNAADLDNLIKGLDTSEIEV